MKKILSIVLTVCLLMAMVIVPVSVQAVEPSAAYKESTLGSYYKFTYGDNGDFFDYVPTSQGDQSPTGMHTYKGNSFYPLWAYHNPENVAYDYKTVYDANGDSYDVLEIAASNYAYFVPLTADGQPFEMTPGVEYTVNIEYLNPVARSNSYMYLGAATAFDKKDAGGISGGIWKADGTFWPYGSFYTAMPFYTEYMQQGANVYVEEGTFTKEPMVLNNIKGSGKREVKVYNNYSWTLGISEERAASTYNAATNSYDVNILMGGVPTYVNSNYFVIGFGYGPLKDSDSPLYSNASASDIGTSEPNIWQIISIEIYEKGVSVANLHVGDEVTTVTGKAGQAIDTSSIDLPAGATIEGWYTDPDFTKKADLKFASGKVLDLYAKLKMEIVVTPGDCNDDKAIDASDLAALKLYLAGAGQVGPGGDCNGDGPVDASDLAALKLYLAGAGTLG